VGTSVTCALKKEREPSRREKTALPCFPNKKDPFEKKRGKKGVGGRGPPFSILGNDGQDDGSILKKINLGILGGGFLQGQRRK